MNSQVKLCRVIDYIVLKYKENGIQDTSIEFLTNNTLYIEGYKNDKTKWWGEVQTLQEFCINHLKWIKEVPEHYSIFMAEILGQNL